MAQDLYQESYTYQEKADYSFGKFRLDSDGTLWRGSQPVHLPPKELAALRIFLVNAGKVVTPVELREALWGDVHVTADSVPKCVSSLRALLEPDDCIQTVYKRGYRFSADLIAPESATAVSLPRLVILPFATEFGVPEHLGGHVAEEAMVQIGRLRPALAAIMARDSVFTLARRGLTALEIGQAMKADFALAGTIRALPAHFRFRAELIRVSDGTQVWVEDMLVERSRPEALEENLLYQLVFRLSSTVFGLPGLSLAASADLGPHIEISPQRREAYEIYQRAHFEWQTMQRHRMQDSLQRLLRATELDPTLLDAWVDLVHLCVAQEFFGFMSPSITAEIAHRAVAQIPDLESRAEKMLPALAWIEFHFHDDLAAALRLMTLSSHLPHSSWITRCRVMLALSRHRFEEALRLLNAAIAIDPYSPWLHARLAWTLHLKGDAEESVQKVRQALEIFSGQDSPALYGSMILAHNGETQLALELVNNLARRLPYFDLVTAAQAYVLATAGEKGEAHSILERLQWLSRERFVISSFTPAAWVALGDHAAALSALHAAEKARCPWFFQMLADPRLKPLEGYDEFQHMQRSLAQMETEADYD